MADQLEGRNPVIECLTRRRRRVRQLWLDGGAKPDGRVQRILRLAKAAGVTVERVERRWLDQKAQGRIHNGVIAQVDPLPQLTTRQLLNQLFVSQIDPFLILVDELTYEHNLGALLRSALAFGVNGLVLPTRRGAQVSPVVQRVSMGAVEEVPIVREGLYSALKPIKKAGLPIVGAHMTGRACTETSLRGPLVLLLGAEGRGLSSKLLERCGRTVAIPLAGELESLNVSVAGAILMYEKRRQDGWFKG
ncbi:MAG: 23S rRNA (guanosine(2251)-2'-O)-methyltransferase RlmB [Proteobacteria bacterium]|jgi:23S rRNA (guanosine2251-2'-O)-methyltransferase|nr:23S rRNA (guanosine(2251)-2'-O)-methyltransferase RlmB [Pseudomonadota bacterium]